MFNIGPGEIIVIGLVLLIAVGPEQLPGVIRRVGKTVTQVRGMTDSLRTEFMAGLDEIEQATDVGKWSEVSPSKPRPSIEAVPNPFAGETRNRGDGEPDDADDPNDADNTDVDDEADNTDVDDEAENTDGADDSDLGVDSGFDDDDDPALDADETDVAGLDDAHDDGGVNGADDADTDGDAEIKATEHQAPDAATRLDRQSQSVTDWISDWSDEASERIAKQSEEAAARVAEQSQRIKNGVDDGATSGDDGAADDARSEERDTA